MADLTSSLRQMRGPYLTDDTAPETPIQPGTGAFQAGVQSALTGISAGATAREAFAAEQANAPNVSALRARAGQLAAESEQQAPRVRSYKDIGGVGDAAEYLAGGLGGAVPYIPAVAAGAAAARVIGPSALRALTPTAGSIAAMYPLEKGAAYLSQYEDPAQAAQPLDVRESAATKQAALKAALLGGAGSSVLRGVMGRAREGIIGGALEAGLPMVGAEAVGQHYASQLNPSRDTSHDTTALIDAALQGGALGAAGHLPSKFGGALSDATGSAIDRMRPPPKEPSPAPDVGPPSGPILPENLGQSIKQAAGAVNERVIQPGLEKVNDLVRENKPKASEFVKSAEEFANDKVDKFTEATRTAENFPDFLQKVFGKDKADEEARTLADGDKAEAYKGADGKVDEEKLFASDEPRKQKAAEYAQMLMDDPAMPDHVKQKVASFNGDFSDPVAQSYIGNTILGQRAGQRTADVVNALRSSVNDLVKKAKDAVPEMKKAAGEAIDNAKDAIIKKNMQEPKTKLEVESLIHKGLHDELQAQPAAIAQVPELAKIITKLLSQGAPIDDTALKTFGGFHALDRLFKDSAGTLESIAKTLGTDDLYKRSAKFRSAEEDSKKADSMLYRAIPPEHREQMKGSNFRELGRFIDSISTLSDDRFKLAVDGLATHVFGSREAARTVVDYYTRKNESELSDTPLKSIEHPLERDAQGIADTNPDKSFIYSSVDYDKAQPFHTSEVGRKGGLDEQLKAEQARGLAKVSKRNMVEHTRAEGIDPVDEIARVQHMIERRIEGHMKDKEYTRGTTEQKAYRQKQIDALKAQLDQIESRKREVLDDEMFKDNPEHGAEFAAENALQDFHVGVLERADADKFAADDRFMRSAKLAYSKQDAASRAANKDKTVTFNMKDGKQLTLYAPSMVKLMGEKQGMGSEEHLGPRSDRLFRDAITSMLLNDKVAGVAHGIRDVRYNDSATLRKTKEEQIRVTKKVMEANKRFNEALSEREKNFEEMGGLISMIKAGEAGEQTFTRLKELQVRNSDLKDAMDKARQDGADIKLEKTDKQEREEQGVTDIVKDIVEKEGNTRINQERGYRKENDVRTTSSGVSAEQTPHDIKKQIFDLRKKLEEPGTPADKKRLRDKIFTLQQELRKAEKLSTQLDGAIAAAQDRITKLNEYMKRAASPAEREQMRAEIEAKKAEIKKLESMSPDEYAASLKTEARGEPSFDELFDKALRVKDAETKGQELGERAGAAPLDPRAVKTSAAADEALSKAEAFARAQQTLDRNKLLGNVPKVDRGLRTEYTDTYRPGSKKKSAEEPSLGKDMTPEEAQAVKDHVLKTRGPDVRVELDKFAKDIGGSGEYYKNGEERVIKVARDALNPQSVAFHESMHDFFHTLLTDAPGNEARRRLLRAAERPWIQAQLKVLLKDHPEALEQIKKDPEEALSYMYQFWASGNLRMNMDAVPIFSRITKFIRDILGVVTRGEQAEAILQAFHDGKLADMSIAGQVIADMHMNTLGDKWESIAKPLRKVTGAWLTPSTDILRNTGAPSLKALADKFHMEPDRERGEAGFMQRKSQTEGKMYNEFQDILDKSTEAERKAAIDELQSMLPPTTKIGMAIRDMLDGMYNYMSQAGVKNSVVENNKVVWKPVQRVADYFPRVWDRNVVRQREAEFKELLKAEGNMNDTEATAIVKTILQGDGLLDLAESERHIGFTPYSSAVKNRGLTFIKQQNAAKFAEFQNKDLVHVMQTYIRQAVHRGEYARYFGNDGEVIKQALEKAKLEGASEKEVLDAARAVRAMEGTLGAEINPRLRDVFNAAVGYENIVLLPFALFSSLIDPLGVAVRSGKTSDAAIAFKDGVKGIFQDAFRMKKDREYEMARTIGVISDLNKLEAMGQVTQSQYSGKWMRKFNDTFFKLNGMETWNERMRVSAMGAGMRFMVRNKDNARYMEELGLEKGDIKELPDGRIARTTDEGLSAEQEQRVQAALFRFVDGAILRPNAAHRPPWTSDPHYMLISHLKQYTFTFQQTILKQVKKEAQNGNYMPAFVLASYIPFMAASDLMRGTIGGTVKGGWTFSQFMADGVARSGVLGTGSFVTDAMKDASMGQMPGSSFLGPTAQHAIMATKTAMGAPGSSWHELFWRSMPASPLSRAIE